MRENSNHFRWCWPLKNLLILENGPRLGGAAALRMVRYYGHKRPTPAMQAGLNDKLWSFEDLYNEVMA